MMVPFRFEAGFAGALYCQDPQRAPSDPKPQTPGATAS